LANEKSYKNGLGPIGTANPVLYAIGHAGGKVYSGCLTDIFADPKDTDDGVDFIDCVGTCDSVVCTDSNSVEFPAASGYDLATGWGSPKYGLIDQLASTTPVPVLSLSAGLYQTCTVKSDDTVWCWGQGGDGELGNGDTLASNTPVKANGITTANAVSVGGYHACALLADGGVQCWGLDDVGQIADPGLTYSSVPIPVALSDKATAVSAGHAHTCAVLTTGAVACWGAGEDGQLGDGNGVESDSPVFVSGIENAIGVSAGAYHTCAWLGDGSVQCWGSNVAGELGNGSTTRSLVPVTVDSTNFDSSGIAAVSAGWEFTCALQRDGAVLCWGRDGGTLGTGLPLQSQSVPVLVPLSAAATSISAGANDACAVLAGTRVVQCWGDNSYGAIGNGTAALGSIEPSPTYVTALDTVTAVTVGGSHVCAISPKAASCWGYNINGQLGDASNSDSWVPATVHFF
jgi:alpha-tubulin suppressor-like RCC1 family protein